MANSGPALRTSLITTDPDSVGPQSSCSPPLDNTSRSPQATATGRPGPPADKRSRPADTPRVDHGSPPTGSATPLPGWCRPAHRSFRRWGRTRPRRQLKIAAESRDLARRSSRSSTRRCSDTAAAKQTGGSSKKKTRTALRIAASYAVDPAALPHNHGRTASGEARHHRAPPDDRADSTIADLNTDHGKRHPVSVHRRRENLKS